MLTALALICSLSTGIVDCDENNALAVFRVPEDFQSPFTCLQHGEAYVASNEIGRDMRDDEILKVVCKHWVQSPR